MVGVSGDPDSVRGDITQNSDGDTGAGERMPHDELFIDTELAPKLAHLVPVWEQSVSTLSLQS